MSISKQLVQTLFTRVLGFVLTFIGSVFITRLLGVEGKGVQVFISANVSLFAMLFGLNVVHPLSYFIAKNDFDKSAARGFGLLVTLLGLTLFVAIILILLYTKSPLINFILPEKFQEPFFFFYMFTLFIGKISVPFFNGNWQGQSKFKIINYLSILSNALNCFVPLCLWLYSKSTETALPLETIFLVLLIITSILFIARLSLFISFKDSISFNIKNVFKPFLVFTMFGWATGVLNFAIKRIDIWFIEYYQDLIQLGFYALAANLIHIFITQISSSRIVISPYITKAAKGRQEEILGRFARITVLVLFVFTLFILPTISFIIPFLYGIEFIDSIIPFKILYIGATFLIFRNVFSVYNIATNNIKLNFYANLLAFIITILLDFILIPKYGIIGASYASLISYLVSSIYLIFRVSKLFENRLSYFIFFQKSDYIFIKNKVLNFLNEKAT